MNILKLNKSLIIIFFIFLTIKNLLNKYIYQFFLSHHEKEK